MGTRVADDPALPRRPAGAAVGARVSRVACVVVIPPEYGAGPAPMTVLTGPDSPKRHAADRTRCLVRGRGVVVAATAAWTTCMTATTTAPTRRPRIAEPTVLVSQPKMPPSAPVASWTASSAWCTQEYGACQPEVVETDEQDVAADPDHRRDTDDGQGGEQSRHGGDEAATDAPADARTRARRGAGRRRPSSRSARRRRRRATVIAKATTTRMSARLTNGSSATSLSEMTMISADRMKSVRIAPLVMSSSSATSPCSCAGVGVGLAVAADALPDLLDALEAEVGATDHEQRGQGHGEELAEQQRRRQDEEQLVAQRADRDLLDDRQLAAWGTGPRRSAASRRCRRR